MAVLTLKAAYVNEIRSLRRQHCTNNSPEQHSASSEPNIYWPSILTWRCPRARFNFYSEYIQSNTLIPDELLLKLEGGNAMHKRLSNVTYIDKDGKRKRFFKKNKRETICSVDIELKDNERITVRGRIDAIRETSTYHIGYEFKHYRSAPRRPYPSDKMQLQFYLGALGLKHGVLVYTSYAGVNGQEYTGVEITEFSVRYSESSFRFFLSRARELHNQLKLNDPPYCVCSDRSHEILGNV